MNKKKLLMALLVVILFIVAIFPRSVEVISGNYLFGFDQGRDYLAVRDIVINKKLTLIGAEIGAGSAGINWIFHGPFHYYFLAIPFFLYEGDPYGGQVLMLLFSILATVFGFYMGNKIFGIFGGLVFAILIAISPPLISQARFVWNSHPTTLFILLAFYFLYHLPKKNIRDISFASFFSAFIYNFELAIAVPMTISVFIYALYLYKFRYLRFYVYMLAGFIVGFLPMILFEVRHRFPGAKSVFSYLLAPNAGRSESQTFFGNMMGNIGAFINNFSDTFPKQPIIPTMFLIIFVLVSTIYFISREKDRSIKIFFVFISILFLINVVVFSFLKSDVYLYYLVDLNLVYIFIFTYCLLSAFKHRKILYQSIFVLLLSFFMVLAIISAFKTSWNDYYDYGGTAKMRGVKDALDYVYEDSKMKKFGLLVFAPPVYTYQYEYVLLWHSQQKYNYLPHQKKEGPVYLLIEPDYSKPWSYKGWLETVVKSGKVVDTTTLPSGFIIQKRDFTEI